MWGRIEIMRRSSSCERPSPWSGCILLGDGLIWSNDDRPLNYLIAGAIFATAGGYGLYKDFIAAPLGHGELTERKNKQNGSANEGETQIRN